MKILKIIVSKKKKKAAPGEMETITVKKELLEGINELKIQLEN